MFKRLRTILGAATLLSFTLCAQATSYIMRAPSPGLQPTPASTTSTAPSDPYWSNVVLLMHFDGTNNSTTFTDVKGHATASTYAFITTADIDTLTTLKDGDSLRS